MKKKLNIVLPPKYRLFVENFDFGMDVITGELRYMSDIVYIDRTCSYHRFTMPQFEDNNPISFTGFYNFEDCINIYNESQEKKYESDLFFKYNLFPIGTTDYQAHFCVGTQGNFIDKIVLAEHESNNLKLVSQDIFIFVSRLKSILLNSWMESKNIEIGQLYKNWNEDFWRVRENKQ